MFPLLRTSLPPLPRSELVPGAPLLSLGELYERALLELDDDEWSRFEARRFYREGDSFTTGDPVVDKLEQALHDASGNEDWAAIVKETLDDNGR